MKRKKEQEVLEIDNRILWQDFIKQQKEII